MIKGIYVSEDGVVQMLGDVATFVNIIKAMQQILPQLEEQQRRMVTADLTEDDLMRLLEEKKKAKDGGSAAKVA